MKIKTILFFLIGFLFTTSAIAQSFPSSESTGDVNVNENAKTAIATVPSWASRLFIDGCTATNNSGGAADLGCGKLIGNAAWSFWALDDSASPDATEDTTDAQDAGTGDVVLFTTTANDGWMLCSDRKFGAVGLTVSQAETGSPVYAYSYYNGISFTAITPIQAVAVYTAADHVLTFPMPADWAVGSTAAVGGPAASDQYCFRAIATTAPTQQVEATIAWSVQFDKYHRAIADNDGLTVGFTPAIALNPADKYLCYFSTADIDNSCLITWRAR